MNKKSLDNKRFVALISAAAILIIAIIFSIIVIVSKDPAENMRHGVVFEVTGSATLSRPGELSASVSKGLLLRSGDSLITGPNGTVTFNIDDNEVVLLEENSKVTLTISDDGDKSHTELYVSYGAVTSEIIQPLTDGSSFSVSSSNAMAIAKGTVYRLGIIDGKSILQVFDGIVDMAVVDENGNVGTIVQFLAGQQGAVTVGDSVPVQEDFTALENLPESLLSFLIEISESGVKNLSFDTSALETALQTYENDLIPRSNEAASSETDESTNIEGEGEPQSKESETSVEPETNKTKTVKKKPVPSPEPVPDPEPEPVPEVTEPKVPDTVTPSVPQAYNPPPSSDPGIQGNWNFSIDLQSRTAYFVYNNELFAKQKAYFLTGKVSEPLLMPAPSGTWQLNGVDFDFENTVITGPIVLVFNTGEQNGE